MTRATLFAVTGVLWLVRSLVSLTDPALRPRDGVTHAAVPALTLIGALLLERGGGLVVFVAWLGAAVLAWRADRATETREPALVAA